MVPKSYKRKSNITFIIGTLNEEKRIAYPLKSFLPYGDVLVVDHYSTDGTVEVAAEGDEGKINELIDLFHKEGISTFLVTNAQYPEQIKNLKLVTQLYISLDAPNKELLKKIDIPLFKDYWERLNLSLEYMAEKKY